MENKLQMKNKVKKKKEEEAASVKCVWQLHWADAKRKTAEPSQKAWNDFVKLKSKDFNHNKSWCCNVTASTQVQAITIFFLSKVSELFSR